MTFKTEFGERKIDHVKTVTAAFLDFWIFAMIYEKLRSNHRVLDRVFLGGSACFEPHIKRARRRNSCELTNEYSLGTDTEIEKQTASPNPLVLVMP